MMEYGSVAQLNRASDYGSEGYRFESCRSHLLQRRAPRSSRLFLGALLLCPVGREGVGWGLPEVEAVGDLLSQETLLSYGVDLVDVVDRMCSAIDGRSAL